MIYFIEMANTKAIKIGFTSLDDVRQRMGKLETGQPAQLNLLGTIPGDMAAEKSLHAEFAAYRTTGEWFEGPPIFRRFVQYMVDNQKPWTFSRAYALLDDFLSDLTDENERLKGVVVNAGLEGTPARDAAWQEKQMHRHYKKFKEQKMRADALQDLVNELMMSARVCELELVQPLLERPIAA